LLASDRLKIVDDNLEDGIKAHLCVPGICSAADLLLL